jgi:TRAP-type C4-dicarboxylate transport system substrate-binding protein
LFGAALLLAVHSVAAQEVQLKIATLAPEGTPWMREARRGAEEIAERTGGRVRFRFYPGGTMGSEQAILRKIRIGQLHGGVVLTGTLSAVDPNLELYNLPLIFRSYDEVDFIRSKFDEAMLAKLESHGYLAFGLVETGFVYLMSTRSTRSFAELEGRKTWVPEGDEVARSIVNAAGLSAVPLALSDVLTGLQTGLIDTVAGPPVGAVALQWFTKAKFLTDLPITYAYGATLIGERAFARIGPDDQQVVREVLAEVSAALDRSSRQDNLRAREALARQGVSFVNPTDEARRRWDEVAAEATLELTEQQGYDPELVSQIQEQLEAFRAGNVSSASD